MHREVLERIGHTSLCAPVKERNQTAHTQVLLQQLGSWQLSWTPTIQLLNAKKFAIHLVGTCFYRKRSFEGSLWPNCWTGRYQSPGERCISWIHTSKVQRPMLQHCNAELLQLNFKHVTWQFWHVTLSNISDGTWTWLRGQHGAGTISPKAVLHHHSLGGRRKCSSLIPPGTHCLASEPKEPSLICFIIELDPSWSRYQYFLLQSWPWALYLQGNVSFSVWI